MKRTAIAIAALLVSALPVLAEEGMGNSMNQPQQGQKNECLLFAKNCSDQVDSIQQRISRLNHEISKGSAVYTPEELQKLNSELRNAEKTLDFLMTNGGA